MFGSENGVDSLTSLYFRANNWYDYGHTLSAKKHKTLHKPDFTKWNSSFVRKLTMHKLLIMKENNSCTRFAKGMVVSWDIGDFRSKDIHDIGWI